MNRHSTEPEYTLESPLERINHSTHQLRVTNSDSLDQVVVELELLSAAAKVSIDTLNEIRTRLVLLVVQLEGV